MAVNPPYANFNLNEGLEDSFLAGAAISVYQRVYLTNTGTILPAMNATDPSFGTAKQAINNGAAGVIRLDGPQQLGLANTLVNIADAVYLANNAFVSSTVIANCFVGIAKYAAPTPSANNANNATPIVILAQRSALPLA
jgi:hypothetical protein